MKKNLKVYAGMGLLILVALFILQNTETVPISFLFWEFRISRALMIVMVFAIGVLVGIFSSSHYLKRN
ncbi:MAG: LapA family protein [Nitrospinae bacterium]|nr:LapA family protein [Nitrospinota bacterium]